MIYYFSSFFSPAYAVMAIGFDYRPNNDFTCFIPLNDNPHDGLLWVNHEYTNPLFVSGYDYYDIASRRSINQINEEMKSVGGSIVRIKKENDKWKFIKDDKLNRRIDANTRMKFNWDETIAGSKYPIGTHSNCSGGITPWGTILTCEENYDMFYGETIYDKDNIKSTKLDKDNQHLNRIFTLESGSLFVMYGP